MSLSSELPIFIISADPLARAGLAAMLEGTGRFRVVLQGALEMLPEVRFDVDPPLVVVWDIGWEREVTEGEVEAVLELGLPTAVLLTEVALAAKFLQAGLQAVLLRTAPLERLTAALSAIHEELTVLDPAVQTAVLDNVAGGSSTADWLEPLTPRENEVLHLLAQGLTNKAIGTTLDISPHTVKFHVTAIMEKLDAQSRTEAVVQATRYGVLRF